MENQSQQKFENYVEKRRFYEMRKRSTLRLFFRLKCGALTTSMIFCAFQPLPPNWIFSVTLNFCRKHQFVNKFTTITIFSWFEIIWHILFNNIRRMSDSSMYQDEYHKYHLARCKVWSKKMTINQKYILLFLKIHNFCLTRSK